MRRRDSAAPAWVKNGPAASKSASGSTPRCLTSLCSSWSRRARRSPSPMSPSGRARPPARAAQKASRSRSAALNPSTEKRSSAARSRDEAR